MEGLCRIQREYNLYGEALCRTEDIASRTFYRPDRQGAACHLTGELLSCDRNQESITTDRDLAYHSVARIPRDIPNTSPAWTVPRPYLLSNKVLFHRTLTAVKFGLVDRVWTFANPSLSSPGHK